jgi:hypothetical protein
MKRTIFILYSISLVFSVLAILFMVNYYTSFGYYLPHKPQFIDMVPDDISIHVKPEFIVIDSDNDYQGKVLVASALDKINLEWYVEQESLKCGCESWNIEYYYSQFFPKDSNYPKATITYKNCKLRPDYPPNTISELND